jgi:hypothetical protein
MPVATLGVFIGLWVLLIWLLWELRCHVQTLRRIGLGGPEEDLEGARVLMRRALLPAAAFILAAIATLYLGARWSAEWRETPVGAWTLSAIGLIAGGVALLAWLSSVHQQWSSTGSLGGMFRAMIYFVISGGVAALAIYWRWG